MHYFLMFFVGCLALFPQFSQADQPKIAFVTLVVGNEYRDAVDLGTLTKENYCKGKGYDYYCQTETLDASRPIPWSKVLLLLDLMEKHPEYDWLYWSDADSLIMNPTIGLDDFIDDGYNLIVSTEADYFNTGHFLIRNCEWSRQLLSKIYAHTECIHHNWYEQLAMMHELNEHPEWRSLIKFLPQRALDAYSDKQHLPGLVDPYYQHGDFLIHFAGLRNPKVLKELCHRYYKMAYGIEDKSIVDFLKLYKRRPIKTNESGMRSQGCLYLWYYLQKLQPSLVIESGVWRGQSTWIIEQGAPKAKLICIDPDLSQRVFTSPKATYVTTDFSQLDLSNFDTAHSVAFFDDHIDAYERVMQCHAKGIKHILFDDNYPSGFDDCSPDFYHLTLEKCFTEERFKEKGIALNKIIKQYTVTPQIVGQTASFFPNGKSVHNIPSFYPTLQDVPSDLQIEMFPFHQDAPRYRWFTYVELR